MESEPNMPFAVTPWVRRLGLDRPVYGPIVIALFALALFSVTVFLVRPGYWTQVPVWDEGYYLRIARRGYVLPDGDYALYTNLPFSPGWPMVLRFASWVTGLDPFYVRSVVSGLLFLIACPVLGWTLRAFSSNHVRNNLAILCFAVWPGSLYFCSAYAETLYLPLLVACFGFMLRRRFLIAAWFAAACWFTRTPAVVVVGALAAAIVLDALATQPCGRWLRSLGTLVFAMAISAIGMLGYMAFGYELTGDWFAFYHSYVAWDRCEVQTWRGLSLRTLADAISLFKERPTVRIAAAWFCTVPVLVCLQRRRMPFLLSVFAAGAWTFFFLRDWARLPFHDMLRWLAVVFPLPYAVVTWAEERGPRLRYVLLSCWLLGSMALYVWCVNRYVTERWVS